jgi:hypothetical protein
VPIPEKITMGEYDNMDTTNYHGFLLIGGYNSPEVFNIDLDQNGINDIQFVSELYGSPAISMNPQCYIRTLNENVQLYGFKATDTMFVNIDTTYNSNDVMIKHTHTCNRITNNDSIASINPSFKLNSLNENDVLFRNAEYQSDTIPLYLDGFTVPFSWQGASGDTTYYKQDKYLRDCYSFPLEETVYIGIKLEDELKLGWLKIRIIDTYKVKILKNSIITLEAGLSPARVLSAVSPLNNPADRNNRQ